MKGIKFLSLSLLADSINAAAAVNVVVVVVVVVHVVVNVVLYFKCF